MQLTTEDGSLGEIVIEAHEAEAEQGRGDLGPFVRQKTGLSIGIWLENLGK